MKQIGIKLADGSFYPIMEEGQPVKKTLGLTTVNDNQTRVLVDVYRSKTGTMEDAEYVDTLQIDDLVAHPNGQMEINLDIGLDENNKLIAEMKDPETGATSNANVTLVSRTLEERLEPTNYDVKLGEDGPVDASEDALTDDDLDLPDFSEEEPSDGTEGSVAAGVVAGAAIGGLAAAAAMSLANKDDEAQEENPFEETVTEDNSDLDSMFAEETPAAEENPVIDDFATESDSFDLPDFGETTSDEEISVPVSDDAVAEDAPVTEETAASDDTFATDSFDLPDFDTETPATEESADTFEETAAAEDSPVTEETVASDDTFATDSFDLPDFDTETPAAEESADTFEETAAAEDVPATEETVASDDTFATDSFDLPDFDTETPATEESADTFEETAAAEDAATTEETVASDDTFATDSFDLPDFDTETPATEESADTFEVPSETEDAPVTEESSDDADGSVAAGVVAGAALGGLAAAAAYQLSKDDDSTESSADETVASEDPFALDETDVADDPFASDETVASDDPFAVDETVASDNPFAADTTSGDNFDLPDFGEDTTEVADSSETALDDDAFFSSLGTDDAADTSNLVNDNTPSNGINFDGLYDKETVEGDSSARDEEDEVEKKTRVPVIICIVCAIICLLATALILFVVPSKYNLLSKSEKTEKTQVVEQIVEKEEPVAEPEPEVVEAKEDEVVVAKEPELVVPEPPKAPENKPKDIRYKIKWGDTLWDIADAYYKNPWRYKYIARYNNIKNPDYIISGTYITIPAK